MFDKKLFNFSLSITFLLSCCTTKNTFASKQGDERVVSERPSHCDAKCNCTILEIDCSEKRLEMVPTYLPTSAKRINLVHNQIALLDRQFFRNHTQLTHLHLSHNHIEKITQQSFNGLYNLQVLDLSHNRLKSIHPEAFASLTKLSDLDFSQNLLDHVPVAIERCQSLREIFINGNLIVLIKNDAFLYNQKLTNIEIKGNPIQNIESRVFSHLKELTRLTISDARGLSLWPEFPISYSLQYISFDRTNIKVISSSICSKSPNVKSLSIKSSILRKLPSLANCSKLELLDLGYNEISHLNDGPFVGQEKLKHLVLNHNFLVVVEEKSFFGLKNLETLDLSYNRIKFIHGEAFATLSKLRDLDLGGNSFPILPTKGLQNLRHIKAYGNSHLIHFPGPEAFPHIQMLALSYAYHCCQYLISSLETSDNKVTEKLQEDIIWLHKEEVNMLVWNATWPHVWQLRQNQSIGLNRLWDLPEDSMIPNYSQYSDEYPEEYKPEANIENIMLMHPIECLPRPSPFMPCEDLFEWWTLRCGAWIVFLMALLGNGLVIIVLIFGRSKLDVPRFLVCNLAVADFLMGIYLGALTIVDAATLGEFKMHAISWQRSLACQTAGFLGVLSTELSVYTLAVITSERNYAITHAMHLNKRLSLKNASYIMSIGWLFAIVMAILPLFGISDYRKFAVCLPFEISDLWSMVYVISLIVINGTAFFILMGCYLRMYCAIRGSQAWNSNDSRIAKRMALLVFTDFLCWAPIAFFTLTAVFGYELISLKEAKVFTVFVLPLNACANPFLYAIFTKQFKKDCILLCKRIEESRVTRGIGRGHNSSNFSNRQTPMNTSSATEKRNSGDAANPVLCDCDMESIKLPQNPIVEHSPSRSHSNNRSENSISNQSKASVIKQMTAKWLLNRKDQSFRMDSTDSTSYPSSNMPLSVGSRRRLDSTSSGNFSSRPNSRKTSISSTKLLEMKRAIPIAQRRSSWTGSTSTSTQQTSTTRSSVSSDSSCTMFRYDLKVGSHVFREDEIAFRRFPRRSASLRRKGLLCKECAENVRALPHD